MAITRDEENATFSINDNDMNLSSEDNRIVSKTITSIEKNKKSNDGSGNNRGFVEAMTRSR